MVKTNTQKQILLFIEKHGDATVKKLVEEFSISREMIHRHLKMLCAENKIKKIGSAPRVFYIPVRKEKKIVALQSDILHEHWLEILPNGEFLCGEEGFVQWCEQRKVDIFEKSVEYETMFHKKEAFKKHGLIDATQKIITSFDINYLEKIWYVDFYSWEIFGKTMLGKLILYAKQNSDEKLMKWVSELIEKPIKSLLEREKFDMVVMIPHSVPRKKDFLATTVKFLHLELGAQRIFAKVFAQHAVAQKTLKSKVERQMNAEETLFLKDDSILKKVLLLDDACGSGATLNIAAQKIKRKFPNTKVYGLTFVGSMNGFEVIAET